MQSKRLSLFVLLVFSALLAGVGPTVRDDKASLQGGWIAQSMVVDGKPAPPNVVKRTRFTFKSDELLVEGNFDDDRKERCSYQIDATKSPRHLTFTPPKDPSFA